MLLGLSKEQISLEKDIYPHTLLKRREHSLSSFTFTLMGKWACVFSKHCWRPTHSGKQTQYELCKSLTWFCWEVYEPGCYPEPLQHAFVYSTRIYWVPTNGPDTVLGVGDTIVNKMNQEQEVPTHMEPTCLSPIMHSHMVTNPSQVYNFSACLVSLFSLFLILCCLARWNFYCFGVHRSCQ